jgi:hypothetical protein
VKASCATRCSALAQAWAELEESQGALQRAAELRSYRLQNWNEIVLPANFGSTFAAEPDDSPFRTVMDTVNMQHQDLKRWR